MAQNYRGLSSCLSLLLALGLVPSAHAQDSSLRVLKSTVNSESKNPELCLEFDKPLAPTSSSRLAAALRLEENGRIVTPANIVAANSSLCVFPLDRNTPYKITLKGLRGINDEKMAAPYSSSITIPDRKPLLAFTGDNGGVNEFGSSTKPLTLRIVNVPKAVLEVYRITDPALMARVWQDRSLTALAPSEAAALARSKGATIWREEKLFADVPNATVEQKLSLSDRVPDLSPGLYLIVADAGSPDKDKEKAKNKDKGLAPLAAAWLTKSNLSLRAVRDSEGIHVLFSGSKGPKSGAHLLSFNSEAVQISELDGGSNGAAFIGNDPKAAEKGAITTIVATDKEGNVAFADVENLPSLLADSYPDALHVDPLNAAPLDAVDVFLSAKPLQKDPELRKSSVLRLSRSDFAFPAIPLSESVFDAGKTTLQAPASPGEWSLLWQKTDGTVLSETPLRVTANPYAAQLQAGTERDTLPADRTLALAISSISSNGKPVPLAGGRVLLSWEELGGNAFGWKGYRFGLQSPVSNKSIGVGAFLTDLQGQASLKLSLPPPPPERGLYQASLKVVGDPDSGIADARPLTLPLHPEQIVVGIKPLAANARFPQNGIARFSLIGLSSGGKAKDVSDLSFQIYEEGRSFAWYQDEGRWKYKPEAQLRPIGAGPISIKADGSSLLDWPVTAGNYRLAILNSEGEVLAQTTFSAGADARNSAPSLPLQLSMPKTLPLGREVTARVSLPENAILTAIIADTRVRKIVHEMRSKGDNAITFTPGPDWSKTVTVSVQAHAWNGDAVTQTWGGVAQAPVAQADATPKATGGLSVVPTYDPSATIMRKDDITTLTFAFQNDAATAETYKYVFSASPGLVIDSGAEGEISLAPKQSKALTISLSGASIGEKELRLEISGGRVPRAVRNWPMAVLPEADFLQSTDTASIPGKQGLTTIAAKPGKEHLMLISRVSGKGIPEILSYVINADPFTTEELALSLTALHQWRDTLAQLKLAPDFTISALERVYLRRLLGRQNPDGGFAARRAGESTMRETAAALSALGARETKMDDPAKALAIGWIKQRLSNTWFDEKELPERAAAFAALAAADAVDPASLHYFSDTSATKKLPAIAEAQVAAAFKRIGEPNAAAFWIKKMLDENGRLKTIAVLNALAATDALPSDDVLAATEEMGNTLRRGAAPELKDAAALLGAIAANNGLAGKIRLTSGSGTKVATGAIVLSVDDAADYKNNGAEPLYATYVGEQAKEPAPLPQGASVSRRIYRLNGVELPPTAKPARGEAYLIEIKGEVPATAKGDLVLVQNKANNLHPIGCPLSTQLGTLSFIPWLSPRDLTPFVDCEFSPHEISVVLQPKDGEKCSFSIAFFAHIDEQGTEIPAPALRILRQ